MTYDEYIAQQAGMIAKPIHTGQSPTEYQQA